MTRRAVVAGAIAQRPGQGGHAWVYLNWLFGLRALGFAVTFIDRVESLQPDQEQWLTDVMAFGDMGGDWSLFCCNNAVGGLSTDAAAARVADADVVFDVMGHLAGTGLLRAARRAVFVDIDPGFGQLWEELGLARMFGGHHHHVTVGLNVGEPCCAVPSRDIAWIPTLPPVAVDRWTATLPAGDAPVTTVATWRGPFDPIDVPGRRLGLRAHQFRRFLCVPAHSPLPIELALAIDESDDADREALVAAGFGLVDPAVVAGTPETYRGYVRQSLAELCIAKDLYVQTRGGWFSDRSACYLAAGRPVAHHDTGLSHTLPSAAGLHLFADADGATAALHRIAADPVGESQAAQALARERFDAPVVLGDVLAKVGVA